MRMIANNDAGEHVLENDVAWTGCNWPSHPVQVKIPLERTSGCLVAKIYHTIFHLISPYELIDVTIKSVHTISHLRLIKHNYL